MEQSVRDNIVVLDPSPLVFPVELLREIVLAYLADSFVDLIVDPKRKKNWDPLSSLLHTSTQFREVTAGFLRDIFGELGLQRGKSTIANYRFGLAELKRVHVFAHIVKPKRFLRRNSTPKDCKSPLIGVALEFAVMNVHYRLYDPSSGATMDEACQAYLRRPSWTPPVDGVPSSVAWRIFGPISERTMSLNHLIQRILSLQEALLEGALKISRDTQQSAIESKRRGFHIGALPTPRHIIEATEPHDALFNMEPPAGKVDDDRLTRFCRGLPLVILQSFSNKQRAALAADPIARTAGRDDGMSNIEDSDESAPTD